MNILLSGEWGKWPFTRDAVETSSNTSRFLNTWAFPVQNWLVTPAAVEIHQSPGRKCEFPLLSWPFFCNLFALELCTALTNTCLTSSLKGTSNKKNSKREGEGSHLKRKKKRRRQNRRLKFQSTMHGWCRGLAHHQAVEIAFSKENFSFNFLPWYEIYWRWSQVTINTIINQMQLQSSRPNLAVRSTEMGGLPTASVYFYFSKNK